MVAVRFCGFWWACLLGLVVWVASLAGMVGFRFFGWFASLVFGGLVRVG